MLKKYYVAETVKAISDDTIAVSGSEMACVWFWQSPAAAYKKMLVTRKRNEAPVNFRRIK
jgi:hypothetical protein